MNPFSLQAWRSRVRCLRLATLCGTLWLAVRSGAETTNAVPAAATNAVAIIVNRANPVEGLTTDELRKYFQLDRARWPEGRKVTLLTLPTGTPERQAVLQRVYHFSEGEFTRHFLQASFAGQAQSGPKELASPVNMRKFVFNVPGALGYVRASEMDDTVKALRIDGLLPGETGYPLLLPEK